MRSSLIFVSFLQEHKPFLLELLRRWLCIVSLNIDKITLLSWKQSCFLILFVLLLLSLCLRFDTSFASMDSPFTAARYHSLVIEEETFPHDALEATAWTEDGLIMAARHKKYKHIQVFLLPSASRALQLMLPLALQAGLMMFFIRNLSWRCLPGAVYLWVLCANADYFRASNSTRRASSPPRARKSSSTSTNSLRNWRSSVRRGDRCHQWLHRSGRSREKVAWAAPLQDWHWKLTWKQLSSHHSLRSL